MRFTYLAVGFSADLAYHSKGAFDRKERFQVSGNAFRMTLKRVKDGRLTAANDLERLVSVHCYRKGRERGEGRGESGWLGCVNLRKMFGPTKTTETGKLRSITGNQKSTLCSSCSQFHSIIQINENQIYSALPTVKATSATPSTRPVILSPGTTAATPSGVPV